MRTPAISLVALFFVACGPSSHGRDGAVDPLDGGDPHEAGRDAISGDARTSDAVDCASGHADGCPCDDPGYTECFGGMGVQCCGGTWQLFHDGPCWSVAYDGGAPTCETPDVGCPCPTEGEISCRSYQWRLVCSGGTWRSDYGHVCC